MLNSLKETGTSLLIAGGFAAFCGSLAYMLKVEEGKPFKWREFLLHTTASAVCGLIAYAFMKDWAGFEPDVCGAFSGISGWMGTRLLRLIEVRITKRLRE